MQSILRASLFLSALILASVSGLGTLCHAADSAPNVVYILAQTDGLSFLATLRGRSGEQKQHIYLYWEDSTVSSGIHKTAIRQGNWKAVKKYRRGKGMPGELFNLESDLGEANNVATDHPDIVKRLEGLMEEAHRPAAPGATTAEE